MFELRSMIAPRTECRMGYADQMNQLTHFIDASHIYGPSTAVADSLRQFVGGLLKISKIESIHISKFPRHKLRGSNSGRWLLCIRCFSGTLTASHLKSLDTHQITMKRLIHQLRMNLLRLLSAWDTLLSRVQ